MPCTPRCRCVECKNTAELYASDEGIRQKALSMAQDGLSSAMKQQEPFFRKANTPLSSSATKLSIETMGNVANTPLKPNSISSLGSLSSPLYQALKSPELSTLSSQINNQIYREQPGSTHSDYTSSLLEHHSNSQMSSQSNSNSNSNLDASDLPGLVRISANDSLRSPPSSPLKSRIISTPQYISSPMKLLELASVCEER